MCGRKIGTNVPRLQEVANFGTNYFLLKIKILAKRERELTTNSPFLVTAVSRRCFIQQ